MGQIKNIKLHIVTDIKQLILSCIYLRLTSHHDVQSVQDRSPCVEKCCSCVAQTTSYRTTCSSSNFNSFGASLLHSHLGTHSRHRSCCQIHRSWSCHRRCCWFWCWYWNCLRKFDHWLCQKPFIETTAVFLRYSRICVVRSYGTFLAYDGFLDSLWIVDHFFWSSWSFVEMKS